MDEAAAFPSPSTTSAARNQNVAIEVPEAEASSPPRRTFEEVFQQTGLGWQAYFAIFITEFIVAGTWATYCIITLYNVTEGERLLDDEFWQIILLLCSMKLSAPWFESWGQSYIRIQQAEVEAYGQNKPSKLAYRKAMKIYHYVKKDFAAWTGSSAFMTALSWIGVNSMGSIGNQLGELAFQLPLGVFAGATLAFFRCLTKYVYWNHFPDDIYDGISQTAKATCLIVTSIGFVRATESYFDLISSRISTIMLFLEVLPMIMMILYGNHFAKPPAWINKSTLVLATLPPREPLPPTPPPRPQSTLQRPSPSRKLQSPRLSISSRTSYEESMSSQKYQKLQDAFSTPTRDENRGRIVVADVEVHSEVHKKPNSSERRRSQSPSIDLGCVSKSSKTVGTPVRSRPSQDETRDAVLRTAESIEESTTSRSRSMERKTDTLKPISLEGTGAIRKLAPQVVHRSPRRSQQDADSRQKTMSTEKRQSELDGEVADVLSSVNTLGDIEPDTRISVCPSQPSGSIIDINLESQRVRFQKQAEEPGTTSRSVDVPNTPEQSNSQVKRSARSRKNWFSCFFGSTAAATTTDESSSPAIPALNLLPSSPSFFRPTLGIQDEQYLTVRGQRVGQRRLSRTLNPDPNQICIDPEPEPTRFESSAVHVLYEPNDPIQTLMENVAVSVQRLIFSMRRSFRAVWFWYTIISTAMVKLISVIFLVACPHFVLHHTANLVSAADTLVWIALPWLVVSIVVSWPIQKLQKTERVLFMIGIPFYLLGITLTSAGMTVQLREYSGIYPWVLFGTGFGVIANMKKTVHKYFCCCSRKFNDEDLGNDALTRNAELGTAIASFILYFVYYICIRENYMSTSFAYFMCTWTGCSYIAALIKAYTILHGYK